MPEEGRFRSLLYKRILLRNIRTPSISQIRNAGISVNLQLIRVSYFHLVIVFEQLFECMTPVSLLFLLLRTLLELKLEEGIRDNANTDVYRLNVVFNLCDRLFDLLEGTCI
jgi:hypothetical protein